MTRRDFLASAAAVAPLARAAAERPRPNVVFFMTDDHGPWALGSAGCAEMHTPNIDRLAAGGFSFNRAFACTPVCSPSRATLYTGKLPSHHGVQDFLMGPDSHGPKSRYFLHGHTTFADVLKANGYSWGLVGTWHLGNETQAQAGFDDWCAAPRGSGPYRDVEFFDNGRSVKNTGYKTDFIGKRAAQFVEDHQKEPFCLTVPFFAPHDPFDYQPEEYRRPYRDAAFSCYPEPPKNPQRRGRFEHYHGSREAKMSYSALVTGVDTNVGRVLDKLDELGLRDNTLVIFTADQGYNCGHHGVWGKGNATIPFNMWEESIGVPLIWNHPGRIAAGGSSEAMVSTYDFFPSLLDYLGLETPPDPERVGRSYAGFLRGRSPEWRRELYFEMCYVRAIRTENLKYIERAEGWPNELFDLEVDPGEVINRIGAPDYRQQARELRSRLHGFFDGAGAPPLADWRTTTEQILPTDIGYYTWEQ